MELDSVIQLNVIYLIHPFYFSNINTTNLQSYVSKGAVLITAVLVLTMELVMLAPSAMA